jgi:hypothetical protein
VGLAGGKVLPTSTGGVPGWRGAGGVEAGLTLAAAQREGAERRLNVRGWSSGVEGAGAPVSGGAGLRLEQR